MLLRKNYTTIISLLSLFLSFPVFADTYDININQNIVKPFEGHLLLGTNRNPSGDSLSANSLYFTRNGKPWYPVMGEIHYVRMPEQDWEASIIKMKASGIDVIATSVFWIYQEEEEGVFDWSGRRSLAKFASLCKKHDMNLFLRIGPWCHGEGRNGGIPDWSMNIEGGIRRNNQP